MTKQEEFIESFKTLMIRYNVGIINEDDQEQNLYYFVSSDGEIDIEFGDIYEKINY